MTVALSPADSFGGQYRRMILEVSTGDTITKTIAALLTTIASPGKGLYSNALIFFWISGSSRSSVAVNSR